MVRIRLFCGAVFLFVSFSQVVPAQTLKDTDQVEQDTQALLKNSTLGQRYYLFQLMRAHPPNPAGLSTFGLDGGAAKPYSANLIRDAAQADGTYEPFGAVFDVLASFGDAGNGSVPGAQTGIQMQTYGSITWESEHYGYENTTNAGQVGYTSKFDFSFGGTLGLYPALVLENLTSNTETIAQPSARPMFQDAFRWSIGPNINHPMSAHAEGTMFADVGQNFLISQVTSYKEGDNTVTATPVSNSAGRAAVFVEGGIEAKILANPIWVAHDDKISNLSPLFLIAAGVRKDTRFAASGDLTGYDHPQDRTFFRFSINLTKITSITDDTKVAPPASLKFGVEIESPIAAQRIPTATRFFVSGNFDVMKIFRPSNAGS